MRRRLARVGPWLVALVVCLAVIGLHAYTGDRPQEAVRRVAVGQAGRLYDTTVTVNSWRIGQVLYSDDSFVGRSGVIFLAVNVTLVTDGAQRRPSWQVGGEVGERTFGARDRLSIPEPGFSITQDVVFELSPQDLAGFTVTFLDRGPIYAYDPQVNVSLDISAERSDEVVAASQYDTVHAVTSRPEVTG